MNKNTHLASFLAALGIQILALTATACQSGAITKEALKVETSGLSKSMLNVVGNDDFNRYINPSSQKKTDKDRYVGIFYFTWLGQDSVMKKAVFNNSRLLSDQYGTHSNEYCFNNTTSQSDYHVDGKIIQFRIPRSAIGASENFKFTFKVTDNITDISDAKAVYKHDDSAPAGRLGFVYYGK